MRERFRARSGAELAALEDLVAAGDQKGVCRLAHNLAGVGGLFGFAELGEAARVLDEACAAGATPSEAQLADLKAALAALART